MVGPGPAFTLFPQKSGGPGGARAQPAHTPTPALTRNMYSLKKLSFFKGKYGILRKAKHDNRVGSSFSSSGRVRVPYLMISGRVSAGLPADANSAMLFLCFRYAKEMTLSCSCSLLGKIPDT